MVERIAALRMPISPCGWVVSSPRIHSQAGGQLRYLDNSSLDVLEAAWVATHMRNRRTYKSKCKRQVLIVRNMTSYRKKFPPDGCRKNFGRPEPRIGGFQQEKKTHRPNDAVIGYLATEDVER
jgi:hypothetical protein